MVKQMKLGNKLFDIGDHTYIMGILNLTPDSFSDGGSYHSFDDVMNRVEQMIKDGADMIDVGGESTRPGYVKISDQEEIERTAYAIEAIKKRFDIPVSIDTYKSNVADAALLAGADMVNDIWGLKYDPKMAEVIARHNAACCLMHNQDGTMYNDLIKDCVNALGESVAMAKKAGIKDDQILLDPGVGFGKTYEQNMIVIKEMKAFLSLGYPVLLGTSRKSCIGLTLDVPVDDRVIGTAATSALAVLAGMSFVRVHDIKANAQAIKMTEAILQAGR